jgi:hypothetical protein
VVIPETAVTTTQSLKILADATNGTLFYDVDAKTKVPHGVFFFAPVFFIRVVGRPRINGS